MARITIEDCLNKVNNRFALIHMGAKRVRQLRKGAEATISSKNKDIVVALREIAAGNVVKAERTESTFALELGEESMPPRESAGTDEVEASPEEEKQE